MYRKKSEMLCLCGVKCDECEEFGQQYGGCATISGKIFWAKHCGSDVCPIYSCCVNEKGLENCRKCDKLPCQLYFDTKDPQISDKSHNERGRQRVNILKS